MSNIWTKESVQKWIDDAGYDAKVLEIIRYKVGKQLRTDIEVTCVECGEPFQRNWYNYRREGDGMCFTCADKRRRQTLHQMWYARNNLLELCPDIVSIWDLSNEHPPEYYAITSNKKVWFKCNECMHRWKTKIHVVVDSIRNGNNGCPKCSGKYSRTKEEFIAELSKANPNLYLIDGYRGTGKIATVGCKICHSVFPKKPINLLHDAPSRPKEGCPVCVGSMIGCAPEYLNSIWSNLDTRKIWEKYVDEEFMQSYMPNSEKKVKIPCPDCGEIKNTTVANITRLGNLGCKCGDTNSYPNKFVFHILRQLKLHPQCEWVPPWNQNIRYDDYLKDWNLIIENHGLQHYEYVGFGRTLEEEQMNDKMKYDIAIQHNIEKYVILDCRKSDCNWIKDSIMSSDLPQIFNFIEEDIDWDAADEYATKNIIKQMCIEWENGLSTKDASLQYGVVEGTIIQWLKKGAKFGWCSYDSNWKCKKVYCFQLDKIFNSINEASRVTGVNASDIGQCCRQKLRYAGVDKKTEEKLVWCFLEEKDTYIQKESLVSTKTVCIETMSIYSSFAEACVAVGGKSPRNIALACNNVNKTAYGFHWSRLEEMTEEKVRQVKLGRMKPAYLYVYCLETQIVYPSVINAQTSTGDWHIYDFIMGTRNYAGKSRHTYYAVYDQKKKDGTIIPGALTLGLLTEDEFLSKLNTPQND